jgi:chemotaxis protein MotA
VEITTIAGILIGLVCLVVAFILEGGHLSALISHTAFLIVIGGTVGATICSFTMTELLSVPKLFRVTMFQKLQNELALIEQLVGLSDKVRREGLLYLENELHNVEDEFMRKGIQLVVDGTDPELVRQIMETELYAVQERHHTGASVFETAGGYAPTMGIIGTVMGLVHVLGNLTNPDELGPAIALAFLATLYGVGSANVFWLPLGSKLKNLSKKEVLLREIMLEGIMSIQAGYNPVLIRERLTAFLRPAKEGEADAAGKDE